MVDAAWQATALAAQDVKERAKVLNRLRIGDIVFHQLTKSAVILVLAVLGGVIVSLFLGALPALNEFGFGFLTTESWNPVTEKFGALAPIYGTIITSFIAMLIAVPFGLMIAMFLTELCPLWLRRPIGIAIELLAGIPSIIYGIWGLFVFAPFIQQYIQPPVIAAFENVPVLSTLFAGPPFGIGILTASLILAIMVLPFITSISRDVFDAVPPVLKEAAYGLGWTQWEVWRYVVLPFTRIGVIGGVMLGLGPRTRRNHGSYFRDRKRTPDFRVLACARHDDLGDDRERIYGGRGRSLYIVSDRSRPHSLCHNIHRSRDRAVLATSDRAEDRLMDASLYRSRRRRNVLAAVASYGATFVGLTWLALILGVLFWEGFSGLSLRVFTEMTPPPGSAGGLLNAIVGSLIMTALALLIGAPIGVLAGTYMAEYGRHSLLTSVVRFINDILLSAPSIVVGLFIYYVMVRPMGHFSGIAGAVVLAVLVIPVMVRTTEDMLTLVPDTLREAAASIGLPRSLMIRQIAYRAAKAGIITGLLLAVARISGETAPLLFTALNNQFYSTNLNAPMASLPSVIFQFALSPYKDWQDLAWTGALIITLAVLAMSILARSLAGGRKVS